MENETRGSCVSAHEKTSIESLFWSTATAEYVTDKTWLGRDGGQVRKGS